VDDDDVKFLENDLMRLKTLDIHEFLLNGYDPSHMCYLFKRSLEKSSANILEVLVEHWSCGVNLIDENNGNTALHIAVRKRDAILVDTLIKLGARTDVSNKSGQTPLDLCTDSLIRLKLRIATLFQVTTRSSSV
jgi:hypothetical protein